MEGREKAILNGGPNAAHASKIVIFLVHRGVVTVCVQLACVIASHSILRGLCQTARHTSASSYGLKGLNFHDGHATEHREGSFCT